MVSGIWPPESIFRVNPLFSVKDFILNFNRIHQVYQSGLMEEKLLYKIRVKGYVQGVGFRWRTLRQAASRGIKGYVKNMPDGSVFIEAEGTREQLRDFADWCRKGPGYVESVTVDVYPPMDYIDFTVRY